MIAKQNRWIDIVDITGQAQHHIFSAPSFRSGSNFSASGGGLGLASILYGGDQLRIPLESILSYYTDIINL